MLKVLQNLIVQLLVKDEGGQKQSLRIKSKNLHAKLVKASPNAGTALGVFYILLAALPHRTDGGIRINKAKP